MPDLKPLFSPDSVAIVGASADTHTLRGRTTQFLIAYGYPGRIYPVTRSQPEVFGLRSYATVAELPEAPDLAVVVVPAAYVAPTLEECGRKGFTFDMMETSFFVSRETLIASVAPGMALWREKLFVSMSKNATKAIEYFNIPTNRVVELGTQVEL